MLKKIEALRLQPKHVRNRYAFWSALSITSVIACIWFITSAFSATVDEPVIVENQKIESSLGRAWSDLKTSVGTSLSQFRSQTTYERDKASSSGVEQTNIIDLNALLASSSPHLVMPTSTVAATTTFSPTSTNAFATSTLR